MSHVDVKSTARRGKTTVPRVCIDHSRERNLHFMTGPASPDPPPPVDLELNAWRELGEEIGRVIDLMPKEQFEDWFPDWFGPRLSELQMLATASVSHSHVASSSDDAICGVCGGWPDDPSHTLVHVQAVLHGRVMQIAARIAGPTAGDLLIRAVDRAMQHGMSCTVEDCPTCDAGFNQIRLAYKGWANSAYVRESRIANTNLNHQQIREAFVRHLQQCPQCHDVILAAAAAPQRQEPPSHE
jgi:hypothetical protein